LTKPYNADGSITGKVMIYCIRSRRKRKVECRMSNKLLNEEEILELKASPHVESASSRSVVFTPEFKQITYDELCRGKPMRDIFEEHGIDTVALGKPRVNGFREKVDKFAKRDEGFVNLKKQKKRKVEVTTEDKLEKRVRQLEHQLAYAKQEVEFLKKIQQVDTEARKQWESEHRQK